MDPITIQNLIDLLTIDMNAAQDICDTAVRAGRRFCQEAEELRTQIQHLQILLGQ